MKKRKHITEFGVNMFGSYTALVQQDDLENSERIPDIPEDESFHIYMIGSRPRIGLCPKSLNFDKE